MADDITTKVENAAIGTRDAVSEVDRINALADGKVAANRPAETAPQEYDVVADGKIFYDKNLANTFNEVSGPVGAFLSQEYHIGKEQEAGTSLEGMNPKLMENIEYMVMQAPESIPEEHRQEVINKYYDVLENLDKYGLKDTNGQPNWRISHNAKHDATDFESTAPNEFGSDQRPDENDLNPYVKDDIKFTP